MTRTLRAVGALALLAGGVQELANGQVPSRIRLGTLAPQGSSYHQILQEMGEEWRTASNGAVQLVVYAGGTMGSEAELVRRIRLGQLHAAAITVAGLAEIDPAVSALQDMPMMYRTLEEAEYVRGKLEPTFTRLMGDKGFVVLFWADAGWVRLFARRPAVRPDDFKTLKVFVTAGATKQFDLMKSAGHSPVALEWSDALTALQTGMIDAVPTIPYYALAGQFYTVAGNMLDLNWAPLMGATIISKKTWDALPTATQTQFRTAALNAGRKFQATGRKENDDAVRAMQSRGLKIAALTPAALTEWRSMAEGFYPQIRGSMVPADIFDEVRRLLNEYRASTARE